MQIELTDAELQAVKDGLRCRRNWLEAHRINIGERELVGQLIAKLEAARAETKNRMKGRGHEDR